MKWINKALWSAIVLFAWAWGWGTNWSNPAKCQWPLFLAYEIFIEIRCLHRRQIVYLCLFCGITAFVEANGFGCCTQNGLCVSSHSRLCEPHCSHTPSQSWCNSACVEDPLEFAFKKSGWRFTRSNMLAAQRNCWPLQKRRCWTNSNPNPSSSLCVLLFMDCSVFT